MPEPCPHRTAFVVASIGHPGSDDPDQRGLPWEPLPHLGMDEPVVPPLAGWSGATATDALVRERLRPEGLDGIRAYVSLGICDGCWRPVVTLRMADFDRWTVEHGPAWSTRWTPLWRDGEPRHDPAD
jgi:hypothetical protein